MCCFSRPVPFVGQTKIFSRAADDGRQMLAYSMSVDVPEELAMVLPLPVPVGSLEDAVTFIDLSGYPAFFEDLGRAFPPLFAFPAPRLQGFGELSLAKLEVFDVGDFEASFAPSPRDFGRLDERFRLPTSFFQHLPAYADYGFAVFRLKPGRGKQTVHPMALSFPRRDPRALFFPTVHAHDGSVPAEASFDHTLYCQPPPLIAALIGWTESTAPVDRFVDVGKAAGLVHKDGRTFALPLGGPLPNEDQWLCEPEGITEADLEGRGECYSYRVRATQAFTPAISHDMTRAWQATARSRLPQLCRALRDGLRDLEARQRASFRLAPLTPDLPDHFMNGRQLWSGTSYMNGAPHREGGGRGRVHFTPFTKQVEQQSIELGFSDLPSDERAGDITRALESILGAGHG